MKKYDLILRNNTYLLSLVGHCSVLLLPYRVVYLHATVIHFAHFRYNSVSLIQLTLMKGVTIDNSEYFSAGNDYRTAQCF
jgi:hypothetical protein